LLRLRFLSTGVATKLSFLNVFVSSLKLHIILCRKFVIVMVLVDDLLQRLYVLRRFGVVGSTLAFGSMGHGFESEHGLFYHHSASAFSKLRSLAKCSLDDSARRLL